MDGGHGLKPPAKGSRLWLIAAIRRAMLQAAADCSYLLRPETTVDGRLTVGVDAGEMGGISVSATAVRVVRQGTGPGLAAVVAMLEAMLGIMVRAIPQPKSVPAKKVVFLVEREADIAACDRLIRARSHAAPIIRSALTVLGDPVRAAKLAAALVGGQVDGCIYVAATEAGPDPGLTKAWDDIAQATGREMPVVAFDPAGGLRSIRRDGHVSAEADRSEAGPDPGDGLSDIADRDFGPS